VQQAPPLSSFVSLGVQHTEALFFGAQQDDAAATSVLLSEILIF
jgi:hypothetical protein